LGQSKNSISKGLEAVSGLVVIYVQRIFTLTPGSHCGLAVLVLKPQANLTRFHGVSLPNSLYSRASDEGQAGQGGYGLLPHLA